MQVKELAAQVLLRNLIEDVQEGAPLVLGLLRRVLQIPHIEEGLVRQVHRLVNHATVIAVELDALCVVHVDDWLRRALIKRQICVVVLLAVHEGAELLELRLRVLVDHVLRIRAIVQILVPVDRDVVLSWNAQPIVLVGGRQLRARLGLGDHDLVHRARREAPGQDEHDGKHREADRTQE